VLRDFQGRDLGLRAQVRADHPRRDAAAALRNFVKTKFLLHVGATGGQTCLGCLPTIQSRLPSWGLVSAWRRRLHLAFDGQPSGSSAFTNEDIVALYNRTPIGAKVIVFGNGKPAAAGNRLNFFD
jgi:hypothetical protein